MRAEPEGLASIQNSLSEKARRVLDVSNGVTSPLGE